jgi:hypothetical protein
MKHSQKLSNFLRPFAVLLVVAVMWPAPAQAQPFGKGIFGADVPFGSETSLAIATGGDVNIQITPTDSGVLGTASNTITVTSYDVVGYKLYIRALSSTSLTNGGSTLAASANVTPAALATNTWGYNTDASSNFTGITASDVLIKTTTGPYDTGEDTTVTYGVKVDNSKPAGNYVTSVVYTAVPQTD